MAVEYIDELTCSLGVTDLDKSIEWYQQVLGFEIIYRVDDIQWCEMKTGVSSANLGLSAVENVVRGGGVTATWSVKDIDAAKAHLLEHDVKLDGDIQHIPEMVKLLTFYDPDGNAMMFAQPL